MKVICKNHSIPVEMKKMTVEIKNLTTIKKFGCIDCGIIVEVDE